MDSQPLIVGVGGSTGPNSSTNRLLARLLQLTAELGARTESFVGEDLAGLPIFTTHGLQTSPTAERLAASVREADAVVIATPGYHGSVSGLAKNALDYLELLRDDVRPYLDGRAVGIIVTAAGWQACGSTLVAARSVVHALRGWPTPFAVTVNSAEQEPDDPRVEGGLEVLAGQLMQFIGWQATARQAGSVR